MNDVELVAGAMREIEIILSEHIEPDHVKDADRAVSRIFEATDRPGVQAAVRRLRGEKAPLRLV
jgi:alpha-D-ribose 1-methylphosphonate 5-triphosphate synthase subunit PhnH